jgi:hypothetical protein
MKIAVLFSLLALAPSTCAAEEQCWADWKCGGPQCAAVMGGWSGSSGPRSRADCHTWVRLNMNKATCRCTSGGGGSQGSSGGGSLQEQAIGHMVDGALQGNVQQFNLGAAGFIGAGIGAALRGDPAAAARAEAARQAAAAEAARQAALRQQRFENNKQELLNQLGDDGDGAPEGPSRLAFKEDEDFIPSPTNSASRNDPPPDDCSEALASHERSMGEARDGAEDFNMAIVQGHLQHGLSLAQTAVGEKVGGMLQPAEWKNKAPWSNESPFGGKLQYKTHEVTFDDIVASNTQKTWNAAAGVGSPRTSLLQSSTAKEMIQKAKESFVKKKVAGTNTGGDWAKALRAFHKDIAKCTGAPTSEAHIKCLDAANATHAAIFKALEDDGRLAAAAKRVEVAKDSYQKYVGKVMENNEKLMLEAGCVGR